MRIILGGLLLSFLLSANAADTDTMSMNVAANQTKFQVTLPSNPTTGYQWTIKKYDKSFLQLVTSQYAAPQTGLMGAGGEMVFTFELVPGKTYPSSTEMLFRYARPWELGSGTLKTVTINFQAVNN